MVSFPSTALVRGFSPQMDGRGYKYIYSSGEFTASPLLLQASLQPPALGRLFISGPKKGGCPCQGRIYVKMWLQREVSFGAAWHPHLKKASGRVGSRTPALNSTAGLKQANPASTGRQGMQGELSFLSLGRLPELLWFRADKNLASISPLKHVSTRHHFCAHAPFAWTDDMSPVWAVTTHIY